MALKFESVPLPEGVDSLQWEDWQWQFRRGLKTESDYAKYFDLSDSEKKGFESLGHLFQVRATPYYAQLASNEPPQGPLRQILVPRYEEASPGYQQMLDPLGERQYRPSSRVIHRYTDRALFLVTDLCGVYCRYCTRKHFTGKEQAFPSNLEYEQGLEYFRQNPQIREVILSGGDPLTLSNKILSRIFKDLRSIDSVEIIRLASRMPVVCPMRIDEELGIVLKNHQPVFFMTHFNHPKELTQEAAQALRKLVDGGTPVLNQMVLLNGVNNSASLVRELSRRLLYLRVKPYYMFQCDPSQGTDHLRTSVENSLAIQRELWGHLSGLAMPQLSLDIPDGGGKVSLVPNFELEHQGRRRRYRGWDGVEADYISPPSEKIRKPLPWDPPK